MKKTSYLTFAGDLFRGFSSFLLAAALIGAVLCGPVTVRADVDADAEEEEEIPKPTTETLDTSDGAIIACRWYPSPNSEDGGKKVVPVIILHGWGGQRTQYDGLATYLQEKGHAVIVPDLRGHGGSTVLSRPNLNVDIEMKVADDGDFEADGRPVPVPMVMDYMVKKDMEAVKAFLMERNNAGELNIELLCVVAVEEMCIVALNWAHQDWSWPQYPNLKQGQDVKALVLISPMKSFKGAHVNDALKNEVVKDSLSIMIVVGANNSRVFRSVKSLHTTFERGRPPVPTDREERKKKQDVFLIEKNTTLQGEKLFDPRLNLDSNIGLFIEWRLVNKSDDPRVAWRERNRP